MAARRDEAARGRPYGELVSQYLDLRDEHPGVIILFRVGSFYEVWFEDAELVARELGLKLGERPSGGSAPPVPQCGFAHHALDSFLPRLLSRGYRVAVVEESDEEAERGGVGEPRPVGRRAFEQRVAVGAHERRERVEVQERAEASGH